MLIIAQLLSKSGDSIVTIVCFRDVMIIKIKCVAIILFDEAIVFDGSCDNMVCWH